VTLVPQLEPGDHSQITVTKTGFKSTVQSDVTLQIAQSAKIDLKILCAGWWFHRTLLSGA
jgi:hypothetical protein